MSSPIVPNWASSPVGAGRMTEGNIGNVATLDDAVAAFNPTDRVTGKTIIRIRP